MREINCSMICHVLTFCDVLNSIHRRAGQVGYVVMGMKSPEEARVGDTFGEAGSSVQPLPLIKPAKPVVSLCIDLCHENYLHGLLPQVFAGIFPSISEDYETLKSAIGKLVLNDSSVTVQQGTR